MDVSGKVHDLAVIGRILGVHWAGCWLVPGADSDVALKIVIPWFM